MVEQSQLNGHKNGHLRGPGLNHQALISQVALLRPESPIRSLFPAELIPGMLSLLAGKPNAATFPIDEISIKLKAGAEEGRQIGSSSEGSASSQSLAIRGKELEVALQYGSTPGLAPLVQWLKEWQSRVHGRPIVNANDSVQGGLNPWTLNVGHGSQDFLNKVFNTLLNPGDSCLVERPVYAGVLPNLIALQANIIPVEADEEGMTATSLRSTLVSWTSSGKTKNLPFPKFVLTTPTGANPSGTTASEQRKRDVLQVVRDFGILLVEDDPYALLSFQGLDDGPAETRTRVRTYFSLEKDEAETWGTGWVLRLDSFSKVRKTHSSKYCY